MSFMLLSEAEKNYIWDCVEMNVRIDGRKRTDYRPMELEADVVTHTNGSARLRLANTDILVGVKTELDLPSLDKPDYGKLEFFVDCSANAAPTFEGKGGEDLASEVCNVLTKAYSVLPLKDLCIVPARCCWTLFVDILILECGGNLYDAVSLAIKAALYNTKIPRIKSTDIDGGNFDLQLSDDLFDCCRLDISDVPCLVTLCKIGEYLIIDPTMEEEVCSVGSFVVSVTDAGQTTAIFKFGEGSFHQNAACEGIKVAGNIGIQLNQTLKSSLKVEEENYKGVSGFLL